MSRLRRSGFPGLGGFARRGRTAGMQRDTTVNETRGWTNQCGGEQEAATRGLGTATASTRLQLSRQPSEAVCAACASGRWPGPAAAWGLIQPGAGPWIAALRLSRGPMEMAAFSSSRPATRMRAISVVCCHGRASRSPVPKLVACHLLDPRQMLSTAARSAVWARGLGLGSAPTRRR